MHARPMADVGGNLTQHLYLMRRQHEVAPLRLRPDALGEALQAAARTAAASVPDLRCELRSLLRARPRDLQACGPDVRRVEVELRGKCLRLPVEFRAENGMPHAHLLGCAGPRNLEMQHRPLREP